MHRVGRSNCASLWIRYLGNVASQLPSPSGRESRGVSATVRASSSTREKHATESLAFMNLQAVIPIFPRLTALDGIGPYEVLQRIPEIDVTFVGHERGFVRTENDMLGLQVDATFEEVPTPDIVIVPGGEGTRQMVTDERLLDWIRRAHDTTRFTTSVCTCLLYTSPSPRDRTRSRMPSSA